MALTTHNPLFKVAVNFARSKGKLTELLFNSINTHTHTSTHLALHSNNSNNYSHFHSRIANFSCDTKQRNWKKNFIFILANLRAYETYVLDTLLFVVERRTTGHNEHEYREKNRWMDGSRDDGRCVTGWLDGCMAGWSIVLWTLFPTLRKLFILLSVIQKFDP